MEMQKMLINSLYTRLLVTSPTKSILNRLSTDAWIFHYATYPEEEENLSNFMNPFLEYPLGLVVLYRLLRFSPLFWGCFSYFLFMSTLICLGLWNSFSCSVCTDCFASCS